MNYITQHVWIYDRTVFGIVAYLTVTTYILIALLSIGRILFIDNGFISMFGIQSMRGWLDIWIKCFFDKMLDYLTPIGNITLNVLIYSTTFVVIVILACLAVIKYCWDWIFVRE